MQVRLAADVATEITRRAIEQGCSAAGVANDALRRAFEMEQVDVPTPAVRTIAERARDEVSPPLARGGAVGGVVHRARVLG